MADDEEFVREHWEHVDTHKADEHSEPWIFFTSNALYMAFRAENRAELFAKGADFTRKRLDQIRQVEQEIMWVKGNGHMGECEFDCCKTRNRIIAREQAVLAELKRGMK